MYAALDKNGKLTYAQQAVENKDYYCCHCDKKVKLILTAARKYFRHTNKNNNGINERIIHIKGKNILMEVLQGCGYQNIESEVYLKQIQQRPDILVDRQLVFEYQCAKLDVQTLSQRVTGYRSMNLQNIWILGGGYVTDRIKREHFKFINFNHNWQYYLVMLDSLHQEFWLFYQIVFAGPFNKIIFKKRRFSTKQFVEMLNFHPQLHTLPPQEMTTKQINKLRSKSDRRSQWIKLNFYQDHQQTVEEFLIGYFFRPLPPIYQYPAWQMLCEGSKRQLNQPLLETKIDRHFE